MKKIDRSYTFYKFSVLTFFMMVSAINYNLFINPANIVAGGVNGVAVIFNDIFKINSSIIILVISTSILLVGLLVKEKKLVLSAAYASLIYPVFVFLTSGLSKTIQISIDDYLLIAIFSGMLAGIISGIICSLGSSQGGIILISQILGKKYKISVSRINTFFSIIIIALGVSVFGINSALYALVYIFANRIAMDKIIIGISEQKLFHIITFKSKEVEKFIINEMNKKYTEFNIISGKNNEKRELIMVAVPTVDYFKLKEGIKNIDKRAFVLITDAFESSSSK